MVEDMLGPVGPGIAQVIGDELVQALLIMARHVAHNVDPPLELEITTMVVIAFQQHFLFLDRLEIDHRQVAARAEGLVLIENIGHAARHARREIAPGLADHDNHAAGHVFAAMVTGALNDRNRAELRTANRSPATPRK